LGEAQKKNDVESAFKPIKGGLHANTAHVPCSQTFATFKSKPSPIFVDAEISIEFAKDFFPTAGTMANFIGRGVKAKKRRGAVFFHLKLFFP